MDDMILEFVAETQDGLNQLDMSLITFEENPSDQELVAKIFRVMHH